eukprot:CAMPEP_0184870004 /NCGR_PEP_ID=MMETSP0580-20130426/36134_1 /TAXON_ID=1118495 /ORGANISM="Dactyliosolen fragilissimus" /LENGTH=528 /DNA_ID=CAMNT_0027371871 /DNA_START=42 /DNA_END=1625 /DNA_ORIENTATION=-
MNYNEKAPIDDIDDDNAFIDLNDAVEVKVDDENIPMEEDDNEMDDGMNEDVMRPGNGDDDGLMKQLNDVPDMSIETVESHKPSSVYTISSHLSHGHLILVSGGGDDRAFLHKLQIPFERSTSTTETIPLSHSHTDSISCVGINAKYVSDDLKKTPKYAAVGSYDGTIIIYNPDTGEKIQALDGPTDVEFLSFHPKGGSVLLAGSIADATVWMYHLPTLKCLQVFVGHECFTESGGVTAGCFTPNGKLAVTVGMDGTMKVWAPKTGLCRHTFKLISNEDAGMGGIEDAGMGGLTCMDVDGGQDGQLAIAGGDNGNAYVVHIQGKKLVATLRHFDALAPGTTSQPPRNGMGLENSDDMSEGDPMTLMISVESVKFAPKAINPNWVATGGIDGRVKIWDLSHGDGGQSRQVCYIRNQMEEEGLTSSTPDSNCAGGVTKLLWHPTLPLVFASYTDGVVRLWDARDGNLVHSLTGGAINQEFSQINDLSVEYVTNEMENSDIAIVVTAIDDGTSKIYKINIQELMENAAKTKW